MSFREMRVFVMFDLPIGTAEERRAYTRFRKFLMKNGFIMMQWSIYSKLCLNPSAVKATYDKVKKSVPTKGTVQLMVVTEKQYASIEYLTGESSSEYISNTDRLIVL